MASSVLRTVKILTLLSALWLPGCSFLFNQYGEICKTHAYIDTPLDDFVSSRFPTNSNVRVGIIPFSVPANLTTLGVGVPGIDHTIARMLHAELLGTGELPIVEILNRQDWPGKKDEFFSGNFGAIKQARDAGYDLVIVGYIEDLKSFTEIAVQSKLIDTASGITVWSGRVETHTVRRSTAEIGSAIGIHTLRPDKLYTEELLRHAAHCIAQEML